MTRCKSKLTDGLFGSHKPWNQKPPEAADDCPLRHKHNRIAEADGTKNNFVVKGGGSGE